MIIKTLTRMKRMMKAKLIRKLPKFEESGSSVGMEGRRLGSVEDRMEDKRLLLTRRYKIRVRFFQGFIFRS